MPSFADFTKNYLGESSNNTAKNKKKVNFGDFTNNYLAQKESRTDYGVAKYNELVSAYRQVSDNASKESDKWHEKSYYSNQSEYLKGLEDRKKELENYFKNNSQKYSKEFLAQMNENLKNMSVTSASLQQNNTSVADYYSQWEDEDAYNRDYDHYTYSNKYKGKTYADLMKSKAELQERASANKNDEALSRELYWLENHSTDRQFADTMTTEELEQYKADREQIEGRIKGLKAERNLLTREPQNSYSRDRLITLEKELESAEKELEKYSGVLYYDDDEVGITTDTLLNMRAADEKFNTQNIDAAELEKDLEIINRARLWLTGEQSDATKRELDYANANPQAKQDMEYLKAKYNIDDSGLPFEVFDNVKELEEYVNWRVDKSKVAEQAEEDKRFAEEHPVLATGKSILTAPLTALEFAGNVLGDSNLSKDEYGSHNLANIYDDKHTMQNETYQNTVSTMIGDRVYKATGNEVASWLASTAYSGVTSAAQSGMTALACTALFGGAGTYVASVIMGTEAAASSYRSAIMNGSTNGEALKFSIASGVAESFFEWASLDKLVGNVLKAGWNTNSLSAFLKSSLKNSGKVFGQGLVEASEEFATELSNRVADAIINGDTSAYESAVRKYKSQGYSDTDAKELAQKDFVTDIVNSMVGGFFGGLGMGGAVNTANQLRAGVATAANVANENANYRKLGQEVIGADNVGNLVGQAKALVNSSNALQSLANEVAGVKPEKASGKKYAKNVGKLYEGVQKAQFEGALNPQETAFKSMVKAELKDNKKVKDIDNVADIITKAKFDSLTSEEQKIFDKFDGAAITEKVSNSEDFDANVEKTLNKSAKNFMETSALTVSEKEAIAKYTGYDISDDGKTYIDATDEEVSIKNFKSVSGGDIVVELDNGSSISVGELRVDSDIAMIAKGLDSLNSVFSIDAQAANNIYGLWKGTENVKASDFMDGMRSAMALAKTNNVKGLETDANTKELPETLRKAMFDVARNIEESKTQARQGAIDKAVESRRESKKGKARAEGTGTVKYDGIKSSDLNSKQKAQADFLSTIFTTMGINVEFFASPVKDGKHVGESGLYRPRTNTIRIDIFAGAEGKGLMLYTASHELTHFIREWSPAKFKKFADFLMENYNENNVPVKQLIQAKINNSIAIAKEDKTRKVLTYDQAYEEVVADACERFLADSNAKDMLVALAQQDQTLAQKILKWIKDFVNLIKNALDAIKGLEPDSKESAYVQEMTDVLEGLRYLWDEALFDAMESYQWVGERVNQNEIAGIDYDALEAAKNENGEELLQIRAIQHDVPEYRALLEKCGTLNAVEIDNLFNTMEKAFAIIEENLEILDYAWDENLNEDGSWDDSTDARAFKPVKPNSDKLYKYSLDFSTLCRKRLLQQVIVEELSMALDRAVTKAESIAIRDELIKLQEEGRQLEIACALCYVESARMKSPEQIQKFLNDAGQKVREFFGAKAKSDVVTAEENIRKKLAKQYATEIKEGKMPSPTETTTTKSGKKKWISLSSLPSNVAEEIRNAKRKAKASYNPTAEEQKLIDIANNLPTSTFTTAEGLKNLAKEQPVIFDAYTSFVRNATHSKGTEKDVWYRVGDADVIGDDLIAAMNNENGLRSQSWSDFQVIHLLDYVGAVIELSTKNAKMQSYTKVADYVNLMGLTDMMINLSLIPTSEFNGKLDFDSVEGMAFKIALELRDKYPSTAGTISIGVADEQIKMLLESKDIDYVIPYHQSGMKQAVRKVMHIPTWVSYENYQGEKKITSRKDAMANANKYGVKLLATSDANYQKAPNFSEWFDLELARKTAELENLRPSDAKAQKKYGVMYGGYKAMQEAADNYIKLCAERGLQPKFSYGKGDFSMESNYWKLLIDRKMINQKTGEIIEQKAVKPVFNEGEVLDILNNEIARYEGVKEDFDYATHYVVERFLNGDMNEHINDIAKHIGETVNNVTKVAAVDVDVKRQDRDSEGRELTPEQAEYFKDSKVRDTDGNLLVVRHGTDADFNIFDFSKAGKNGKAEGYGFYFSDDKEITNRYGNNQMEVYLNITKPMLDSKRTVTKSEMIKLTNALIDYNIEKYKDDGLTWQDSFISNYVNTYERGMSRTYAVQQFVNQIWEYNDNDQDLIFEVAQADGKLYDSESAKEFYDVLTDSIGYDGIISEWKNADGASKVYVTFTSQQAKRTTNLNPTDNEDIRYQDRNYAPIFYSQMGKVVEAVKQEKLGAASVIPMLKGKGIKNEEIKWSGIETFLEGKKSVTKKELLDFIAGSMLQIEETMLEDTVSEVEFDDVEEKRYGELVDKAEALREELAEWWNKAFGEELPQAIALSDYRDTSSVALDIVQDKNPKTIYRDEYNLIVRKLHRVEESIKLLYQFAEDRAVSINTKWSKYKLENGSNYRELIFKMPNSTYSNDSMKAHWTQENKGVLAHARIQDFVVNGKKMLFVEEIQSDWHNEGATKGYASDSRIAKLDQIYQQMGKALHDFDNPNHMQEAAKLRDKWHELEAELKAEGLNTNAIPDAPFRNNYHEYVLKRLIRMAAEEGYDSIGWTTADIQSKRWSEEYAEGYRIEYDQDIPKFLNKYGKKWGAKVESSHLPRETRAFDEFGNELKGEKIWSMDITDSMKESVLYDGQTMFQNRVTPEEDAEYLELAKNPEQNEARLREMVDAVAKRNGYNFKGFHGTSRGGFTKFKTHLSGMIEGVESIFLSKDSTTASSYAYGSKSKVYSLFAKIERPLIVDCGAAAANGISLKGERKAKLKELVNKYVRDAWNHITSDVTEASTDQIGYAALRSGEYDGVVFKTVKDSYYSNDYTDVYEVFTPSQVKSADLVTYDDEGNIIPLSERFNEADEDIRYSMREIVGESGKNYGIGVYLDSTLLDGLSDEERIEMVKEYIKELGGEVFTAYDNNNNAVDIRIAKANQKFKNKNGKRNPVNKDLTSYLNNEVKQEAIVLIDELITVSTYGESYPAKYSHDWLDNYGKNDWDYWKVFIQEKNKTIWEATLNIANATNGEKILYDVFPIKMVEQSVTSDTSTTENIISNSKENVNTKFQDREISYGKLTQERIDYLIADSGAGNRVDYANSWIANISPSDFIDLTTTRTTRYEGRDYFDTKVQGDYGSVMGDRDYIADLKNIRSMPYLKVDMDTGKVLGHNGRHRMRALEKAGARRTPVAIIFYKDEYVYKGDDNGVRLESIDVKRLASQFDDERYFEYHGYIHDIIPLNEDHREEIEKTYLAKPFDVKYGWAIAYQDRTVSNREILVDAMSNIDELSIEDRNRLETYKTKIDSINALEKELADVGRQIHEIITTQGSDREQVKILSAKAETLRKKISRVDGQLLKIEAMQPIQKLVEIRRKQILTSYKKEVQEQRKKSVDQRYRTATRGKIKRVINELNSILNNGTKERNVKFGLQDTVNKALEMAKLLNANFSNEEVLMADTMTSLTEKEKKLVDEYRQLVANRDSYNERIEKLQQNTENTNYKLIDELAQMRNKAYKEIKKLEKQLSDVIERNRTNLNDTLISDAINSLATSYKALEKSQDEFIKDVYSEYVYDRIAAFGETIKGTKMQDMTLIQLQEMYDIYKMVMATVRASNQLFMGGKRADVNKAVSGVLFELDKRNKAKALPYELADKALDAARDFSYKEMKPVYFFERLGSQTLKEIFFDEARKGEDIFARDTEDAKKFIQTMRAKHGYKSWDMEKGFDITLSSGRKLKLTLGEIMSIYAYSKREQALEHMTNGGFVFNSKEYFKTDKKGKKSVRTEGGIPYRINEFDFVKIKQMMTDEQIKYVDDMQDYLSSVMGAKGNEVSRILYGIDLFKEKYYFPLMSSQDFVAETNKPAGEVSLKNTGMAKATVPHAKNPIVLQSFEDVWANHVGKMSTYHALVLPIENMNKVLNYAEYVGDDVDSVSVKGVIGDLFTKSATDYIKTYIRDLNGGVTTQGAKNPFAKMFTNFKKTAVAASMSTVVQQPTAILRAMAMINPKYFSSKPSSYEEIKKYAPIAILKEMGGFDAGSGRTASGYILQETYEGGKEKATAFFKDENYRDSILMKGAEKGDEFGWGIIWSAVKKEVADTTTYAKGSKEFFQACGERFTEVISYTQVYDSVFSRSEYMRSKNELVKMSTAFMGEPTTSFNMLYNAVLQAKRGNVSKGQAIGTMSAVIVSIIAAAVAKSFIYGLRDDDDDESYLYKYTESLKDSLISDLNPLNMLPFVSDVTSLFSGWDVERTDMAIFKDIKDAVDGLDSDSKSTYRKIEDLSGAIAALAGIPWKNVMRTFREGYNLLSNIFDDNTGYDGGTPASSEVNELLDKGRDAKAKETIKEILEDKTEKYVKEGYSKAEAEKKAKSSLKSSVTSYWKEMYLEAYENKDSAEMLRIRKILQSTGLYDNVVETCQNWIKNKKNTTETDSEWDKW